jgi:hypothetical protein
MLSRTPIKRKRCKCGNPKCYPSLGYSGWNFKCASEDIRERIGSKKDAQRKAANARKAISVKLRAEKRKEDISTASPEETIKEAWFKARRKEMTGYCCEPHCKNKTNKDNDTYFRWSICHIVPKALIPSVAYHPLNFIELCQQHHQEFDNTFDRAAKMGCFINAKRRFDLFKYLIPNNEFRKINPHLTEDETHWNYLKASTIK